MNPKSSYRPIWNRHRLVLIANPDPAVCETLSMLFRLEGFMVKATSNEQTFFELMASSDPTVLVCDSTFCGEDHTAGLGRIRAFHRGMIVIMTMAEQNVGLAVDLVHAGAHHVFAQPWNSEELLRAVNQAVGQSIHMTGEPGNQKVEIRGFTALTPRENEVAECLLGGMSNKETGKLLDISPRTVEVHRARVMYKLGARNTADLVRIIMTA